MAPKWAYRNKYCSSHQNCWRLACLWGLRKDGGKEVSRKRILLPEKPLPFPLRSSMNYVHETLIGLTDRASISTLVSNLALGWWYRSKTSQRCSAVIIFMKCGGDCKSLWWTLRDSAFEFWLGPNFNTGRHFAWSWVSCDVISLRTSLRYGIKHIVYCIQYTAC